MHATNMMHARITNQDNNSEIEKYLLFQREVSQIGLNNLSLYMKSIQNNFIGHISIKSVD